MTITDYEDYPATTSTVLRDLNVVSDTHVTSGLKRKPTWMPRQAMDNNIENVFKLVWYDMDKEEMKKKQLRKRNLKHEEYIAMKTLKADTDLIVKRADKGGNIVVMNRVDYENEIYTQLCDTECYEKLSFNPIPVLTGGPDEVLGDSPDETRVEWDKSGTNKWNVIQRIGTRVDKRLEFNTPW
ncbi:hypothetical protein NDU88_003506 [Pleurodeles waltl]|uniref:Uncharacterized protein n=1 Tax=Pleurodeles waltl TaxID=8319 RepID=A0AAV7UYM4_PLEWA|nr:hypothetical protein NDU88_003506 [Pleurodeles waltl]